MGDKLKQAADKIGGTVKSGVKKVKNWVKKNQDGIREAAHAVSDAAEKAAPEIEKIEDKELKSIVNSVVKGAKKAPEISDKVIDKVIRLDNLNKKLESLETQTSNLSAKLNSNHKSIRD